MRPGELPNVSITRSFITRENWTSLERMSGIRKVSLSVGFGSDVPAVDDVESVTVAIRHRYRRGQPREGIVAEAGLDPYRSFRTTRRWFRPAPDSWLARSFAC